MGKIPFGKTISYAYGFAAGEYLAVLGITWLPIAISLAVTYLVTPMLMPGVSGGQPELMDIMRNLRWIWLLNLVTILMRVMMTAGVTAQALGLRRGPSFVYFSLGATFWRLLVTFILAFLVLAAIVLGLVIVCVIAATVLGVAAHGMADVKGGPIVIAVICFVLIMYGALIYIGVRLFYLIAPVVVAEKKIDLIRAWTLTHGNFWRIFGIFLAIGIPFGLLAIVVYGLALGWEFLFPFSIFSVMAQHNPAAVQSFMQHEFRDWSQNMTHNWQAHMLIVAPIGLLLSTLWYGLSCGAAAFAYRSLVPTETVPNG